MSSILITVGDYFPLTNQTIQRKKAAEGGRKTYRAILIEKLGT